MLGPGSDARRVCVSREEEGEREDEGEGCELRLAELYSVDEFSSDSALVGRSHQTRVSMIASIACTASAEMSWRRHLGRATLVAGSAAERRRAKRVKKLILEKVSVYKEGEID